MCIRDRGTALRKSGELSAFLDLKPALTSEQLDARILREFELGKNKQFKNVISVLFPSSLTPVMLKIGGISPEKPIHEISREERLKFGALVKTFPSVSYTHLDVYKRQTVLCPGWIMQKLYTACFLRLQQRIFSFL